MKNSKSLRFLRVKRLCFSEALAKTLRLRFRVLKHWSPSIKNEDCCKIENTFFIPDDILIEILARVPRSCYLSLKLVSRSWKSAILNPELYKIRKQLGKKDKRLYVLTKTKDGNLVCYALDPLSQQWQRITQMPRVNLEEENKFSFCGYSVAAINGCIYVLGGLYKGNAVSSVWRYDPIINIWSGVAPMLSPRAYFNTTVLDGKLYVIGGLNKFTSLKSGEVFDPCTGSWAQIANMPFSKLGGYLPLHQKERNLFSFQATGMVAYEGKIYAPQSMYCLPLFLDVKKDEIIGKGNTWPQKVTEPRSSEHRYAIDIGGDFYDPKTNCWSEIKKGMGDNWPSKRAGVRSSVVVNGKLIGITLSRWAECGRIVEYDEKDDEWKRVGGSLHVKNFAKSIAPCLLSGYLGKLHVVSKDENNNINVILGEKMTYHSTFNMMNSSYRYIWKIIASKDVGSEELVSCQVLDI